MSPPVAGYTAWYDATQITGQTDGSSLALWPDLSGHGHNLSATGGAEPTYHTSGLNSMPTVSFDGTDDYMPASPWSSLSPPFTGLFVASVASDTGSPVLFGRSVAFYIQLLSAEWSLYDGADHLAGTWDTSPHVFTIVANSIDNTNIVRIDGVQAESYTAGSALALGQLGLGGWSPGVQLMQGTYNEVLVYPSALDGTDIGSVEDYLTDKWFEPPAAVPPGLPGQVSPAYSPAEDAPSGLSAADNPSEQSGEDAA